MNTIGRNIYRLKTSNDSLVLVVPSFIRKARKSWIILEIVATDMDR